MPGYCTVIIYAKLQIAKTKTRQGDDNDKAAKAKERSERQTKGQAQPTGLPGWVAQLGLEGVR
jgi:hypothetical protein